MSGLADTALLDQERQLIEQHDIVWTTCIADDYPYLLKHIHLPPVVIYWQGEPLHDEQKRLAIVGSRKANQYGKQIIEHFVPTLVVHDWVIVSGGALGIDSMSHEATVQAGGKTIAVLGSGLLRPYPYSNKKLFRSIIEHGGTILSSFPLRMEALPGNFPARNRIIAGISRGSVVVQAAAKSGARITAQFALDQGRDVFAVPGPIDDELSAGCHALIQEGAKLVASPEDILNEYGEQLSTVAAKQSVQKKGPIMSVIPAKQRAKEPDSIQGKIIGSCRQPCSTDELAQKTGLGLPELQNLLFELQLEGAIRQDFTVMWVAQ